MYSNVLCHTVDLHFTAARLTGPDARWIRTAQWARLVCVWPQWPLLSEVSAHATSAAVYRKSPECVLNLVALKRMSIRSCQNVKPVKRRTLYLPMYREDINLAIYGACDGGIGTQATFHQIVSTNFQIRDRRSRRMYTNRPWQCGDDEECLFWSINRWCV